MEVSERDTMHTQTISFIQSLYETKSNGFRFHPQGKVTLLSTCFSIQALYLINEIGRVDGVQVGKYLLSQQRSDGLFIDKQFKKEQLSGLQSSEYIEWQFTFFSLIALDMLGILPQNELGFLAPFQEKDFLVRWLDNRNWDDFWYCSNEIMFLLFFLTYSGKYSARKEQWIKAIDNIFLYLDSQQDKSTGFWGKNVRSNLRSGMFGAAHIYLFYDYFNRDIQYKEQIVRSTIKLQQHDGLYGPSGGGACEDYDAVEILARLFYGCPEQQPEIRISLDLTLRRILAGRTTTGGYGYRLVQNNPVQMGKRIVNRILGRTKYRYSGWSLMECDTYYPDIWGTYFRLMTLAHIENLLDLPRTFNYRSYPLPGWGYLLKSLT